MFNNLGTALEQLDRLDEARAAYEQGGKLGSKVAMQSRKRLEGVTSIAIARQLEESEPSETYDLNEDPDDEPVADERKRRVQRPLDHVSSPTSSDARIAALRSRTRLRRHSASDGKVVGGRRAVRVWLGGGVLKPSVTIQPGFDRGSRS